MANKNVRARSWIETTSITTTFSEVDLDTMSLIKAKSMAAATRIVAIVSMALNR